MSSSLGPNFSYHSRFNPNKNFTGVKFGADSKLLEVELNELQDMLAYRQRQLTRTMYPDGLFSGSNLTYSGGVLALSDAVVSLDGDVIEIERIATTLNNTHVGQTIYLRKGFEVVKATDPLREHGNLTSGTLITNDLIDSRYNQETSRRIQMQYSLTTVRETLPNVSYLALGRVSTLTLEGLGSGSTPIFIPTVLVFIPLWQFQASYDIDGGSFTDASVRLMDGGYFHEDSARVVDGGYLS